MFFRIKPSGPRRYLQIVENERDGAKTRQSVIATLGRVEELDATGKLDVLLRSGARFCETAMLVSSLRAGTLDTGVTRRIGAPLVFDRLWEETGCRRVIEDLLRARRFEFPLERAIFATVLHRLMVSGSDRHASGWCQGLRIPGADGLDLDDAYKAMAWLGAVDEQGRSTAEAVEEALYRHRQPLFGAVSIAFFDTTTLWFEGAGGESLVSAVTPRITAGTSNRSCSASCSTTPTGRSPRS